MARTAQSIREMHDWYMADGRRSLASVAREFDMGEEEVRARFVDADLELKTAQPLRGAAAKNKAKAEAKQNGPHEFDGLEDHEREPVEAIERGGDEDLRSELSAEPMIRTMIEVLDSEIALLVNARVALAQVLGEGGEDE